MSPKTLLVVYHSLTGASEQLATKLAAAAAERANALTVLLRHASQAMASDVLHADGYVFVCPETLGNMAGLMKDFFDRTYYPCLGQIEGRPYALLVCAGSDGTGAVRQIERIATGWRLRAITDSLIICTHAQSKEAILQPKIINEKDLALAATLGETFAEGLCMGVY